MSLINVPIVKSDAAGWSSQMETWEDNIAEFGKIKSPDKNTKGSRKHSLSKVNTNFDLPKNIMSGGLKKSPMKVKVIKSKKDGY